ncbi:hypothetical protein [Methylobacter marinus]|uniref:hypothetical protein n=1 Tax=Methylobacter marinus TaxID=34058 RepID=UPI00036244AF|nr:hypothetical protein [Methylobacter marinus]
MDNLALSALQLDSRLDHCTVYQYRIVYHKFDETEASEKLARKAAYELLKVNNFALLTNLGNNGILSLKPLSQLSVDSPHLQASLKADGQLELDCCNEQHQEALQRLINQDINKAAWNLKQASEGKLDCRKATGGPLFTAEAGAKQQ